MVVLHESAVHSGRHPCNSPAAQKRASLSPGKAKLGTMASTGIDGDDDDAPVVPLLKEASTRLLAKETASFASKKKTKKKKKPRVKGESEESECRLQQGTHGRPRGLYSSRAAPSKGPDRGLLGRSSAQQFLPSPRCNAIFSLASSRRRLQIGSTAAYEQIRPIYTDAARLASTRRLFFFCFCSSPLARYT